MADQIDWVNRLAKWRSILAGWQVGTRPKGDPESDAIRHHREGSLIMRAELTALTGLMIKKGIFTAEEFHDALQEESRLLSKTYEDKFPGAKPEDYGMSIDVAKSKEWMSKFPP